MSPVPEPEPTGSLELRVARQGGRHVIAAQRHQGALRLLRPVYLDSSGQPCLIVVNPGGGYVGGDRYRLTAEVGEDASALVTTQSATKVYRTAGRGVLQEQRFIVADGAVLEVVPDPLIAYQDAEYLQRTSAVVAPTGRLVLTDIVTPGWAPDGSPYRWRSVLLRTSLTRPAGEPIATDTLRLVPDEDGVAEHGFLGRRTHLGTLLAVAPELDQDAVEEVHELLADREARVDGLRAGVSPLSAPGLAVRVLGPATEPVHELLLDVHAALRRRWGSQPRLNLRKY